MKIIDEFNGNQKTFISNDINGEFKVSINGFKDRRFVNGMFQLSVVSEPGDTYVNLNLKELKNIRDLLNEAIQVLESGGENNIAYNGKRLCEGGAKKTKLSINTNLSKNFFHFLKLQKK